MCGLTVNEITHTHTRNDFHVLWGLSIDVMIFILYKLYILSPTLTLPLNLPITENILIFYMFLYFQNTLFSMIYKLFSS